MKKIIGLIILSMLMCSFAGCSSKGELKINDVTVAFDETAKIVPQFIDVDESAVQYTFDGANISINDGVITGLVADSETTVYATSQKLSTSFTVRVLPEVFGQNASTKVFDDVFKKTGERTYNKTDTTYGEAYYYQAGIPLNMGSYLFSGSMEMSAPEEGATAEIILKESDNNFVKFEVKYTDGTYVFSSIFNNTESLDSKPIKILASGIVNFSLLKEGGTVHLFLDGAYTAKASASDGKLHLGFGGSGSTLTLSRLQSSEDAERIAEFKKIIRAVFGVHAYGQTEANTNMFFNIGDGKYEKRSYHYSQIFYYESGLPLCGNAYTARGTIEMVEPDTWGQAVMLLSASEGNSIRFVFEKGAIPNQYYLFSDKRIGGVFSDRKDLISTTNKINFTVVYDNGRAYLFINDQFVDMVENSGLGRTHFGFSGEKCKIIVTNLSGTFDADYIK